MARKHNNIFVEIYSYANCNFAIFITAKTFENVLNRLRDYFNEMLHYNAKQEKRQFVKTAKNALFEFFISLQSSFK